MNLTVKTAKGEKQLSLPEGATVMDLKKAYGKVSGKSIHRQYFKVPQGATETPLNDNSKTLESYGVKDVVTFKDLGPQIGYRTVFVLEYLGPILFLVFYYLRPSFIYGAAAASTPYNWVAEMGVYMFIAHFLKREFETFFVHKFSRPTMPLSNLFKNCTYYWAFAAVIGYPLCNPAYEAPADIFVYVGAAVFIVCELGNLMCHVMLSNLRPAEGSTKRPIPKGFLFDYVACPNYTYEIFSWVGFSILTGIPFSYAFTLVGFYQMAEWAQGKHRGYKKTYGKEYIELNRKAIVPFVY